MIIATSAPAEEPISLAEAKAHLKVDFSADDSYISALIVAARQEVEQYCAISLVSKTFQQAYDGFPLATRMNPHQSLILWRSPLVSLTSIVYTSEGGVSTTESSSNYVVDSYSKPPRVSPAYGYSWQSAQDRPASVIVTFVAGYGDASDVPTAIKQAMLLMIGNWYDNREDSAYRLPMHSRKILDHYRISFF